MNIQFSSIISYTSFLKENTLSSFFPFSRKTALIAATIFSGITLCFAYIYCVFKAKKLSPLGKAEPMGPPEIISDDWGAITLKINGLSKNFKDVIILPSDDQQHAEEWNWKWDKEHPMRHHPGVRIKDVEHLIFSKAPKPDVIILSQGRGHGGKRTNPGPGILEITPDVEKYINSQGISEVYMLKTDVAIEKYKEMRNQGQKRIAALIHTTC